MKGCAITLAVFSGLLFLLTIVGAIAHDSKTQPCKDQCRSYFGSLPGYSSKFGFDEVDLCLQHCDLADGHCPAARPTPNSVTHQGCMNTGLEIVSTQGIPHSEVCGCGKTYKYSRGFADKINMEVVE